MSRHHQFEDDDIRDLNRQAFMRSAQYMVSVGEHMCSVTVAVMSEENTHIESTSTAMELLLVIRGIVNARNKGVFCDCPHCTKALETMGRIEALVQRRHSELGPLNPAPLN